MNKKLGPELFYTDASGQNADADLHNEMLDGVSPEGKTRLIKDTKALAKELGLTPQQIKALYG